MIEIKAKLKIPRAAYKLEIRGRLALPFQSRQKGSVLARLLSGEEVAVRLPPGEILRGGDLATASDGRVIEIVAAPEKLLHVESDSLAKAAYHLGERHVPVELKDGFLRIAEDPVLEQMLRSLGARVTHVDAPFEPDARGHGEVSDDAQTHDHQHHDHEHCDHDHHHHK